MALFVGLKGIFSPITPVEQIKISFSLHLEILTSLELLSFSNSLIYSLSKEQSLLNIKLLIISISPIFL